MARGAGKAVSFLKTGTMPQVGATGAMVAKRAVWVLLLHVPCKASESEIYS